MGVVGGSKGVWTLEGSYEVNPFPTVMARVEVPSDMKEEREIDVRGLGPWKIF